MTESYKEVDILQMKKFFIISNIFFTACVSLHNISNSSLVLNISSKETTLIQAEEYATSILHLTDPSLHILDKLKLQCRDGVVHGIETTLSSRELLIFQSYRLHAIAHCTKN